ncbi:hypothetical protein A1D22_10685 [Pasteurellaceae bacterium LFhippo2]|nr:hypothetical protein [Pasteurellaceae bacterium LFhippo2]
MLTLQIIGGLLGIALIGYLLFLLIRKIFRVYWENFEFHIFSKKILLIESIIIVFTILGVVVSTSAQKNNTDIWNGYVLYIIAMIIFIGLIGYIYKKTDFKYGTLAIFIVSIKLSLLFIIVPLVIITYLIGVFDDGSNKYVVVKRY